MAFTKTDTADIEVSYDEAKFNFPHNRRGYRKFLQFIPPPNKVFQFDKEEEDPGGASETCLHIFSMETRYSFIYISYYSL